jgi:hypothetical protein
MSRLRSPGRSASISASGWIGPSSASVNIPAGWTRPDGTGDPAEAARLLESEGVAVLDDADGNRYGHPRHYINWEQLDGRLRHQAVA